MISSDKETSLQTKYTQKALKYQRLISAPLFNFKCSTNSAAHHFCLWGEWCVGLSRLDRLHTRAYSFLIGSMKGWKSNESIFLHPAKKKEKRSIITRVCSVYLNFYLIIQNSSQALGQWIANKVVLAGRKGAQTLTASSSLLSCCTVWRGVPLPNGESW